MNHKNLTKEGSLENVALTFFLLIFVTLSVIGAFTVVTEVLDRWNGETCTRVCTEAP